MDEAGSRVIGSAVPTCLAVVGTGRSGTSATSGLLVKLGLAPPVGKDLVPASASNEQGHWESRTMIKCNNRLLRSVGCSTYGPPDPAQKWKGVSGYDEAKAIVDRWIPSTFLGTPVALKDPRMSLTLGFWREVLPAPIAALMVLRDPVQNARSREARDGVPVSLGLAIWDRYQRCLAVGLEGLPTLVMEFGSMLANPKQANADVVGFLRQLGIPVAPELEDEASTWLNPSLRHQDKPTDVYDEQAVVQREIFEQMSALVGVHESWSTPTNLPAAPLWVDDMIRLQRDKDRLQREARALRSTRVHRIAAGVRKVTGR
jgi:hypothetical protein